MSKPAAICRSCFGKLNNSVLQLVYMLRTDIGTIKKELDEAKRQIAQLFEVQQELEQALFEEEK